MYDPLSKRRMPYQKMKDQGIGSYANLHENGFPPKSPSGVDYQKQPPNHFGTIFYSTGQNFNKQHGYNRHLGGQESAAGSQRKNLEPKDFFNRNVVGGVSAGGQRMH